MTSDNISAIEATAEFVEQIAIQLHSRDSDDHTLKWAKQSGKYRASLRRDVRDVVAALSERGFEVYQRSAILAEARKAEAMEREIAELKADLAELRAFAASFKLTCVESSFYKDCYLHIHEPDAVSFRLGNGSQFSKFIAKLEDRRARTLLGRQSAEVGSATLSIGKDKADA